MRSIYSSGDLSWSLALMVVARSGPFSVPFGWLTFAAEIALRKSAKVRPYAASV